MHICDDVFVCDPAHPTFSLRLLDHAFENLVHTTKFAIFENIKISSQVIQMPLDSCTESLIRVIPVHVHVCIALLHPHSNVAQTKHMAQFIFGAYLHVCRYVFLIGQFSRGLRCSPMPREWVFEVLSQHTNWVPFHTRINFGTTNFEQIQRQTDLHSNIKSQLRAENAQTRRLYKETPSVAERWMLLASPPLFSPRFARCSCFFSEPTKKTCLSPASHHLARKPGGGTHQTYHFGAFVVNEG